MGKVLKITAIVGGAYVVFSGAAALFAAVCMVNGMKHRYGDEEGEKLMREFALEGLDAMRNKSKEKGAE